MRFQPPEQRGSTTTPTIELSGILASLKADPTAANADAVRENAIYLVEDQVR